MTIHHEKWTSMNEQIVFQSQLDTRVPFAIVTVHAVAAPDDLHVLELKLGAVLPVQLSLAGGVMIDGSMLLQISLAGGAPGRIEVTGDLRLSQLNARQKFYLNKVLQWAPRDRERHDMVDVEMPDAEVTPAGADAVPAHPVLQSSRASEPVAQPAAAEAEELFSYIYLSASNALDDATRRRCFVEVPQAVLDEPFPSQLAALPAPLERTVLALQYRHGKFDGAAVFVACPDQLQGLVHDFPMVPVLVSAPQLAPAAFIDQLTRLFGRSPAQLATALAAPEHRLNLSLLWQSYLALLLGDGIDDALLMQIGTLLLTGHWLDYLFPSDAPPAALDYQQLDELFGASLVLPAAIANDPSTKVMAGRLQMARQRFLRHEFGDLASVESVMPRERRELARKRTQVRVDQHGQGALATTASSLDAADTRTSLASQARQAVAEQAVRNDYDNFQTSYGPPAEATLGGKWTVHTVQGRRPGLDDSTRFARDILSKTVSSIGQEVHQQRVRYSIDQDEQSLLSVVDNSQGTEQLVCARRWINTVYEASVASYGERLMVEVVLRSPHDSILPWQEEGARLAPWPVPLAKMGVASFADVSPEKYAELAATCEVTQLTPPPAARRILSVTLRIGDDRMVPVPSGYQVDSAVVNWIGPAATSAAAVVLVGGETFPNMQVGATRVFGQELEIAVAALALTVADPTPAVPGTTPAPAPAPAAPSLPPALAAFVSVTLTCLPTAACMDAWRIATYGALLAGYQRLAAASLQAPAAAYHDEYAPRSALAQRRARNAALRGACIGSLLRDAAVARNADSDPGALSERFAIQLVDDAFEWDELRTRFYHQPERCVPANAVEEQAGVLRADMARVLIPVHPQHALSLLYFLDTGCCWSQAEEAVPVHADHLAMAYAIKHPAAAAVTPSAPWQVIVPTAMQALDPLFRVEHHSRHGAP